MKKLLFIFLTFVALWTTQAYELEVEQSEISSISRFYQENLLRLQEIKSTPYYGIEVLIADENNSQIASQFGHAAIRFVGSGGSDLSDYVISLEMFVTNPDKLYRNAILGGYEVFPRVYTLLEYINNYQVKEARGLNRIVVPSKKESIELLLDLIEKMITVPDLLGDYNFLTNNCMTALLKLLNASNIISTAYFQKLIDSPSRAEALFRKELLSPYPSFRLRSSVSILKVYAEDYYRNEKPAGYRYRARSSRLYISFDESNFINVLTEDSFWTYLSKILSPAELEIINFFWPQTYLLNLLNHQVPERSLEIYLRISMKKSKALQASPSNNIQSNGLKTIPRSLYRLCPLEDSPCRLSRLEDLQSLNLSESTLHITRHWYRWPSVYRASQNPSVLMPDYENFINWYESDLTQDMLLFSEEIRR